MKLLTINSKISSTSKTLNVRIVNFGITAYKSESGRITCPFADLCVKYCYARKGTYRFKNTRAAYEARYQATLKDDFVDLMSANLMVQNPHYVRIHDSGDFYSKKYLMKWVDIINKFPNIRFYAYTNSVSLMKQNSDILPVNLDIIFSTDGKERHLIDRDKDRHAVIFDSSNDMERHGYINASKIDLYATRWFNNDHRVGLIKH